MKGGGVLLYMSNNLLPRDKNDITGNNNNNIYLKSNIQCT